MKKKRKQPNMSEKLAALHIEIEALKGNPIADWSVVKQMTPEQINSLFEWNHVSYWTWVEEAEKQNHPSIITPLYIRQHRERTAKIDMPTIAKARRIAARRPEAQAEAEKLRVVLGTPPKPKKRKMQSRGFQGSRSFSGEVRWRKRKGD